jgi:radical SAM protein with 4Fe4S-binding SPASM domain
MSQHDIKPSIVAFEVTRRCPLHCRHCRASSTHFNGVAATERSEVDGEQDSLSTDQCKRILDSVAQLKKCVIVLTGGEPMTRPDVFELVEYGQSIGHRMAVATCGAMLNAVTIERFKEAGLQSFSFSLDGATEQAHDMFRGVHGAFQMVLKAACLAYDAGLRFQINTVITVLNADKLDLIAQLAVDLGAACWNPFMLVPVGRAEQDKTLFLLPQQYDEVLHKLAQMKKSLPIELRVTCGPQFARIARQREIPGADTIRGCRAAEGFVFISYKGDVQTCGFLEISAGNLLENGYNLTAIWNGSPLLNYIRNLSVYQGACGGCEFLNVCRGCRARAYAASGDFLGADPMCIKLKN